MLLYVADIEFQVDTYLQSTVEGAESTGGRTAIWFNGLGILDLDAELSEK
jgi:hypothetical protein